MNPRVHCGMTIGWHIQRYWGWTFVRHVICRIKSHQYYSGYYDPVMSWKFWCMRCGYAPKVKGYEKGELPPWPKEYLMSNRRR